MQHCILLNNQCLIDTNVSLYDLSGCEWNKLAFQIVLEMKKNKKKTSCSQNQHLYLLDCRKMTKVKGEKCMKLFCFPLYKQCVNFLSAWWHLTLKFFFHNFYIYRRAIQPEKCDLHRQWNLGDPGVACPQGDGWSWWCRLQHSVQEVPGQPAFLFPLWWQRRVCS